MYDINFSSEEIQYLESKVKRAKFESDEFSENIKHYILGIKNVHTNQEVSHKLDLDEFHFSNIHTILINIQNMNSKSL